ncbi:SGNH/GDSL hydrolase family protein [Neorhizobium sp. LMR1-1-1.1]
MPRARLLSGDVIGNSASVSRPACVSRAIATVLLCWLIFLCGELAVQGMYYWHNRQGIFAILQGKERYQFLPGNLKLLNPRASRPDFRINALGLRDDEVAMPKPTGHLRIAIVGGSSVMGEKARINESRFSDIMRQDLVTRYDEKIDVLNVGVSGASLHDLGALVSYITTHAAPDIIVLYPGGNDISQACVTTPKAQHIRAPQPSLPAWWLSTSKLRDKTMQFRAGARTNLTGSPASKLDLADYTGRLTAVVNGAKAAGQKVYLMTNARAFGRDQSSDTLERASASFRNFASCFSPGELADEFDAANEQIRLVAQNTSVQLIDTGRIIPHDEKLFADSVHFSELGEHRVAEILESALSAEFKDLTRP